MGEYVTSTFTDPSLCNDQKLCAGIRAGYHGQNMAALGLLLSTEQTDFLLAEITRQSKR
jgi:hypothetical protein